MKLWIIYKIYNNKKQSTIYDYWHKYTYIKYLQDNFALLSNRYILLCWKSGWVYSKYYKNNCF